MTKDDVIRLAREADWPESMIHPIIMAKLADFAKLVAAEAAEHSANVEREACAKVCDDLPAPPHIADSDVSMWDVASMECADAIRARGQA